MKNRSEAIDGYRGLMLFVMTCGHLAFLPFITLAGMNVFVFIHAFTGFGWLSVVEGFCFLSGLVAGIASGRRWLAGRQSEVTEGAIKRTFMLYLIQIVMLLAFASALAMSQWYYDCFYKLHSLVGIWIDGPGIRYFLDHPCIGAVLGSLFIYLPPYFDILPLFMCFTLITPLILRLIGQGNGNWVLMGSFSLWLFVQFIVPVSVLEAMFFNIPHDFGWFSQSAFQLVYIVGLMIGFEIARGEEFLLWKWCGKIGALIALALPILYFSGISLVDVDRFGWMRVVGFSLKALLAYGLAQVVVLRPFVPLGRWSLSVFIYHLILVFGLTAFYEQIGELPQWLCFCAYGLTLSTLWVIPLIQEWRQRVLAASPNVLASSSSGIAK